MPVLLWSLLGFAAGALPFSVWLGRLFLKADVRGYGDHNPGAANAWRAGGWQIGLPVLLLDFLKGALAVGLARALGGLAGWQLAPVGLAPVCGHMFSPFLRFHGGKGLAVTFGVWTGLTLAAGPLTLGSVMGSLLWAGFANAWAALFGLAVLPVVLLWQRAEPAYMVVWAANLALLAWKHRRELHRPLIAHNRFTRSKSG